MNKVREDNADGQDDERGEEDNEIVEDYQMGAVAETEPTYSSVESKLHVVHVSKKIHTLKSTSSRTPR